MRTVPIPTRLCTDTHVCASTREEVYFWLNLAMKTKLRMRDSKENVRMREPACMSQGTLNSSFRG